jgi:hypothetical protein
MPKLVNAETHAAVRKPKTSDANTHVKVPKYIVSMKLTMKCSETGPCFSSIQSSQIHCESVALRVSECRVMQYTHPEILHGL